MSARALRTFLDQTPRGELQRWYDGMRVVASAVISRLRQRSDYELPEPPEVVDETVHRILDSRVHYVWDEKGSLDEFFIRCMGTTANGLRSAERRNAIRKVDLDKDPTTIEHRSPVAPVQLDVVLEAQFPKAAEGLLSHRVIGKRRAYTENLPRFARLKSTTSEIAEEIGITELTVKEYRKRLRSDLKRRDDD